MINLFQTKPKPPPETMEIDVGESTLTILHNDTTVLTFTGKAEYADWSGWRVRSSKTVVENYLKCSNQLGYHLINDGRGGIPLHKVYRIIITHNSRKITVNVPDAPYGRHMFEL